MDQLIGRDADHCRLECSVGTRDDQQTDCDQQPAGDAVAAAAAAMASAANTNMRVGVPLMSIPRRKIAQIGDGTGIEPLNQRHHQIHHAIEVGPIDDAVVGMGIARGHHQVDRWHTP